MGDPILKILIADDEAPALNRLRELLADMSAINIIAEAKNGLDALHLVNDYRPDIVLLDIRMPRMDGIEAAQHLQKMDYPPAIIFTTAFDSYAMQAFDMQAVDYLLKPIRLERLQAAMGKARALLPQQLEALAAINPHRSHFSVNERGRILLVPVEDVIYLRAEQKYITIRTAQREYLLEESLTHLEQEFGSRFIRLHRNCLVASASILGYEKRSSNSPADANAASVAMCDKQWFALLKDVPETIAISRRQQHLIHHS